MDIPVCSVGHIHDADSESDTSDDYRVEPSEYETIRDVNLHGVITSLMNRITISLMSLLSLPTTSPITSSRYDCLLRKVQLMKEVLTTLQYIVAARETPVEFPEQGSMVPYADPRRRDMYEHDHDGPLR